MHPLDALDIAVLVLSILAVALASVALWRKSVASLRPLIAAADDHAASADKHAQSMFTQSADRMRALEERLAGRDADAVSLRAAVDAASKAIGDATRFQERLTSAEARVLESEKRLAAHDLGVAGLQSSVDAAAKTAAGVPALQERLETVEADNVRLTGVIRYDLTSKLAEDAASYAAQQEKVQGHEDWSARDKMDSALAYAATQAKVVGVDNLNQDALRLAIEAKVGTMNQAKLAPSSNIAPIGAKP